MDKDEALSLELPERPTWPKLFEALKFEMPLQIDRLFTTTSGKIAGAKLVGKSASESYLGRHAMMAFAANFPVVAAVTAVGVAVANMASEASGDYAASMPDYIMAMGYLTHAPVEKLRTINKFVASALRKFSSSRILEPLTERVQALKQVASTGNADKETLDRLETYTAGLEEATQLQALLTEIIANIEFESAERTKQSDAALQTLELNYRAGLVNQAAYIAKTAEIKSAEWTGADGANRQKFTLMDFYLDVVGSAQPKSISRPPALSPYEQPSNPAMTALKVIAAVVAIAIIILIVAAQA